MLVGFVRESSVPFVGWSKEQQVREIRHHTDKKMEWILSEKLVLVRQNPEARLKTLGLINAVHAGNDIYIAEFSRLFRNLPEIGRILKVFKQYGARLISVKENFNSAKPLDLKYIEGLSEFLNAGQIELAGEVKLNVGRKIGRPAKNARALAWVIRDLVAGMSVSEVVRESRIRAKNLGVTNVLLYTVSRDYIHRRHLTKPPMQEYYLGLTREELMNDDQVREGAKLWAAKLGLK